MRLATRNSDESSDYRFRFAEATMAVILGVLLVETPRTLRTDVSLDNYQAVLLLTSVFVFVEMYIVLGWYHGRGFGLPYHQTYLFLDVFIAFVFVAFVVLIESSEGGEPVRDDLEDGLVFGTVLFLLLVVRQLVSLRAARAKNADLYQTRAKQLWSPIVADLIGIALLVLIRASLDGPVAGLSTENLSQLGLLGFAVYAFLAHAVFDPIVSVAELRSGRRKRDVP